MATYLMIALFWAAITGILTNGQKSVAFCMLSGMLWPVLVLFFLALVCSGGIED